MNQFTDVYEWYGLAPAVVNATCNFEDEVFIVRGELCGDLSPEILEP